MDIITQGLVGAAIPLAIAGPERARIAALCGGLAGLAPDLDVLIQSSEDPLLYLEYHRQFTHAIAFVPFGSALVALVLFWAVGRRLDIGYRKLWLFCALGMASHGVLDACTSYGTQLLWPFADTRFAWSIISIVDPLFSLPLLGVVLGTGMWRRVRLVQWGICWGLAYLCLGVFQQGQALDAGMALADARGHTPVRMEAKPSFANLLVWKTVYEADGQYFVDAVRVGFSQKTFEGASILKLDLARDFPGLDLTSRQVRDIERFRWFSDGILAKDPMHPNRIIDVRYSLVPNEIDALWSIEVPQDPSGSLPVQFLTHRGDAQAGARRLKSMLFDD